MKTYTKEQQQENLKEACKALRENPKKAIEEMRDCEGGRCCLAVMEDYAKSVDPEVRKGDDLLPHEDLSDFYGLPNIYGCDSFTFLFNNGDSVADCNDGKCDVTEHTHVEIAKRIEKDFID